VSDKLPMEANESFRGFMSKKLYFILSLFGISFLSACGGGQQQVSGIFAEAQFSTEACQPKSKIVTLRNDDTQNPQRVQGVSFEMGTNEDKFFKIDKVTIGGTDFTPSNEMVQDVIIPAGGVMSIQATYNPKRITPSGTRDTSYLDIFLNGPRLGIMQVRLSGEADTAAPGCGSGPSGTPHTFTVDKITVTINATSLAGGTFSNEITGSDITKPFKFTDDSGTATTLKDDFPNFNITGAALPGGSIQVVLSDDTNGTFDGSKLEFDPITFTAGGAISVTSKLTTDSVSASGSQGNINLTGSALSAGKMKLVFAAKLDNPLLSTLNGGVVGFEMELTAQ